MRDKAGVLEKLKANGLEIHGEKYQKDLVFFPNDIKELTQHLLGRNYMRIREEKKNGITRVIFTLKQPRTNQTDCIEHEVEIQEKDISEMTLLIETLGYYQFITIEKTRITASMGDIEICIDEVAEIGSYIELEKFGDEKDAIKIQNDLYALLESWDIKKEDYTSDGYDLLVYKNRQKN